MLPTEAGNAGVHLSDQGKVGRALIRISSLDGKEACSSLFKRSPNRMGIGLNAVHLLAQTLPLLGDSSDKRLLTLEVQDCHFTYDQIVTFLRRHGIPHKPISADGVLLTTGFKWAPSAEAKKYRTCIHQQTLFTLLGFSARNIHSVGVNEYEGADNAHDLNFPIDDLLRSRFDLAFDGGTIEHVSSIKDALFNMC